MRFLVATLLSLVIVVGCNRLEKCDVAIIVPLQKMDFQKYQHSGDTLKSELSGDIYLYPLWFEAEFAHSANWGECRNDFPGTQMDKAKTRVYFNDTVYYGENEPPILPGTNLLEKYPQAFNFGHNPGAHLNSFAIGKNQAILSMRAGSFQASPYKVKIVAVSEEGQEFSDTIHVYFKE